MNAQQRVVVGAAFLCAGSYLIYQGYEGAGRARPWWARFLPGA